MNSSGMMALCQWLEQTTVGASVRQSGWLFPLIESLHLLGMAAMVGTISAFDLRLLGWSLECVRVTDLARRLIPWMWAGFAVQVITGGLLFSSEATHIYANPAFQLKMFLLALAGLHALVFHFAVYRNADAWDDSRILPPAARAAGAISILIWAGVVAAGRFIGFV